MIHQILIPLDGSTLAEAVLPHASRLAKAFGSEALVLRVVGTRLSEVGHYIDTFDWRLKRVEAERYVERIAAGLAEDGVRAKSEVAVGRASEQILATARRAQADLVVLTTHGEGGRSEFHVSGTAAKVVGPAECSVLLVPPPTQEAAPTMVSYRTILVPVDCSPRADWSVCLSGAIARITGAELVLLYVVTTPEAVGGARGGSPTRALALQLRQANREAAQVHLEEQATMLAQSGLRARLRLVENDDIARTIRTVADEEGTSLVVMAAHGARAASEVPHGMVAASLLGHSPRPLLLLQDAPPPRLEVPTDATQPGRRPTPEGV